MAWSLHRKLEAYATSRWRVSPRLAIIVVSASQETDLREIRVTHGGAHLPDATVN